MSEEEIISKYFSRHLSGEHQVKIGIGDDAAVVQPPVDSELIITTDTLNAMIHFQENMSPYDLGHKALAVNLSDIAAMGSIPLWATINLSLPEIDHTWLKQFSDGLFRLADTQNVKIIGGDLVRGPLSITIQLVGRTISSKLLLRSGAHSEQNIFVTGTLGDAAMGLHVSNKKQTFVFTQEAQDYFLSQLYTPEPRVTIGQKLVGFASAVIDISDGLLIDLQRILKASQAGAELYLEAIPLSNELNAYVSKTEDWSFPLTGGEDYELLFTANRAVSDEIFALSEQSGCRITKIGKIMQGNKLTIFHHGKPIELPESIGFDHFE